MLAFAGLSQLLGGSRTVRRRAVWCALALFVIGGLCSVAHLASPLNAISAVTNLLSFSGISIELMLLGASFIAGAAYLVLTREEGRDGAVRVVAVLAVIFGVAIGFFCGHGYVIDAQPTWGTETLPLAYLGTSLALGAFAYALVAAATKTPADKAASAEELGGKLWPAVLVCAVVDAVGILAYGLFLGLDAVAAQGVLFWGGAVACGVVGVLACAIAGMTALAAKAPAALAVAGVACAAIGGVALRMLMWACATGYLNLFSHGIPSVMLNL